MPGMIGTQEQPPAGPSPGALAPGGKAADPQKVQAMLILQPVRLLYQPEQAQAIAEAARNAEPAKVLAAAAVASVMASAKAADGQGVQLDPEQVGAAVVEVIKAGAAILVAQQIVPPEQIGQVVDSAIEFAQQNGMGEGAEQGGPPPAAGGAGPGPGGVESPGMAGPAQPMGA